MAASTLLYTLANLGFPEILLWLLTFAVVYGVLSHVGEKGMPKSQAARAIIAMVSGFFVLFSLPAAMITVIAKLSSSLILVVVGLLIMIVFLEVGGVRVGKEVYHTDKDGKQTQVVKSVPMFEKYGKELGIALILITILIFIGSGGLQLLGLSKIAMTQQAMMSIAFFVVIILGIIWMINEQTA